MAADPWRNRARRVVESRLRPNGDVRPHHVVCGQDALAFYVVNELLAAGARVTVIVGLRPRADGPDIRAVRGIRVVRAARVDEATLRAAGLAGAQGLALMEQNDVGNIHAALCAQEVEPHVRLVMRMFNPGLGAGVKRLFADCQVLSDASMAAPAFVAAALGEVTPTHFRHGGRTLHVARRADVRPEHVVCGLADTRDRNHPRVLPAQQDQADLVLAEATGQPAGTVVAARRLIRARRRRRPAFAVLRALRLFVSRKIGIATMVVFGIVAVSGVLLARATEHLNLWQALYLTLLTAVTGAEVDLGERPGAQVMQVVLTLAGLALVPLITAVVVEGIVNARLAINAGRLRTPRTDHVVVLGLGNVGTRVMWQLHDLGVEVVAIDKDPDARGAEVARRLGVPLIIGDGAQEETLREASVATCQALVVVSTDDVTNLQAALNGRAITGDLRVVLRLFDGDFAERIQKAFNMTISRSVSYLAAPAFAAALMRRDVIATIPVSRHVLLVAEVTVAAGSALDGERLAALTDNPGVRVIAFARAGQARLRWGPPAGERLAARDRVTVVARRAGLSWLLKQTSAEPPPDGRVEIPAPRDPTPPA
ncbi:Trk K+ transport system, NAD-binding component [Micromonospora pattaloongensis]|uniref:Trk K+ transport system, NAD-binding component n=1 Tax=Micromonospora pattaloongensis TaxID=405436 RepID=A0A1H3H2L7_9ACTN|nr:NAD-binding protein [Micromonospora pattaloongensis]SDY09627.1 Trk K+ transport system, NAD-binding component [Micromonospora pattaloongensis]